MFGRTGKHQAMASSPYLPASCLQLPHTCTPWLGSLPCSPSPTLTSPSPTRLPLPVRPPLPLTSPRWLALLSHKSMALRGGEADIGDTPNPVMKRSVVGGGCRSVVRKAADQLRERLQISASNKMRLQNDVGGRRSPPGGSHKELGITMDA